MISPSLIDPADVSTGPLPYVPRAEQVGSPGGASRNGDPRRRTRLAAVATTGVLLVAGVGGWALASASGGSGSDQGGSQVALPGADREPGLNVSGFPSGATGTMTATGMTPARNSQPISAPVPGATASPSASPSGASPSDAPAPTPSPSPTRGTVPPVVGKKLASAQKDITDAGFGAPSTTMGCNTGSQAGDVFNQSPAAGRTVELTTVIRLDVQKNDCAFLPEVTGDPVPGAVSAVQGAGFTVTTDPASCQHGTGTVQWMSPWGGRSQSKSEKVTLGISCLPPPTTNPSPATR